MANTAEQKIFVAVREILKASTAYKTQGGVIQQVYDGLRSDIPENAFPCVILEPGSTSEEPGTTGRKRLLKFKLRIACFMECVNFDNQIVGATSPSTKGIIDLVNDIKNAIEVYPDLNYDATGKRCNFYSFPEVQFEAELFPFRVAEITMQATVLTDGASLR